MAVTKPRLMDQVRLKMRVKHMAKRTEKAYVHWILEFLHFHRNKAGQWLHPAEISSAHVNEYLTHLAVDRHVAASTQNQAQAIVHR